MKNKFLLKTLTVFLLSIIVVIPSASAWNYTTHQNIATQIYNSLPRDIQQNLVRNQMIIGANVPDVVFNDTNNHMYPASVPCAETWLNNGEQAYLAGNYSYASYCFGIASHYISDTFSAPHCFVTKSFKLHSTYENQVTNYTPEIHYMNGTLESIMQTGYTNGRTDYQTWSKTQDPTITPKDLNNGASASYTAIINAINQTPNTTNQTRAASNTTTTITSNATNKGKKNN